MLDAVPAMVASVPPVQVQLQNHVLTIKLLAGSIGKPVVAGRALGADNTPLYPAECRARAATYAAPMNITLVASHAPPQFTRRAGCSSRARPARRPSPWTGWLA